MVWIEFILSSALLTFISIWLAKYGDIIAIRTRLGGMFVGTLLMAGATSLPEMLTMINSIFQGFPNLAAGNLLGSNMINMFLLAVMDMMHYKRRILRKAALKHALSGSLVIFLSGLVVFFILADLEWQVGWVGADSLMIMLAYFVAISLIRGQSKTQIVQDVEIDPRLPTMRKALFGFGVAVVLLVVITPWMVNASGRIAETTGLGVTFIGSTLVAFVTSLPELVTTLAAIRIGADDMAIGNLFGSNLFNMFALGFTDVFFLQGRFLSVIDPSFLVVGVLGLIMTSLGLIGNLARLERRLLFVEVDAFLLVVIYIWSIWFLYSRGIG